MIDQKKRNTLKTLSLAGASAAIPAVAAVAAGTSSATSASVSGGLDIAIKAATALTPAKLVITNSTSESTTLRHVSPGLVKSKGELFDINQVFGRNSVTVVAGQTRTFVIDPMLTDVNEIPSPGGVIASDMVSVTTRYRNANGDGYATTRRMMLS